MTRPGRVEVYREGFLANLSTKRRETLWTWRFRAANGRIIARCSESHGRLRNVARSLELAFPGYRLLDQDGGLEGPDWFLWGLQATCTEAYLTVPEDLTLGMGMRGVKVPVVTPVNLSSRVRRG